MSVRLTLVKQLNVEGRWGKSLNDFQKGKPLFGSGVFASGPYHISAQSTHRLCVMERQTIKHTDTQTFKSNLSSWVYAVS